MKELAWLCFGVAVLFMLVARPLKRSLRKRRFSRGRTITKAARPRTRTDCLTFGVLQVPKKDATRHFLTVGTTGSGKSLVQRKLMQGVLPDIVPGSNARALIFDAKNDMPAFLKHIEVTCPVYTLNPFDARSDFPISVAWDIAKDVTSCARALNLAATLIPAEKGGNNQYFTDAARQVLTAVIESFIRHSPGAWTFPDLVIGCLSLERVIRILDRDADGQAILAGFLREERTAYQVYTTIVSRLAYYKPVAALWQRATKRLSLREWLHGESILLLGSNSTAKTALDAINEVMFRVLVEEIDVQPDSATRRTWFWIDEARLSGPLLQGPMIPYLCVKGRSRGACLVLAFQDIEGFREAAGTRIANEIIAQCSYKALLRMESDESASWASKTVGQHEVLQHMKTEGSALRQSASLNEHVARRDAVLASEFYLLPMTCSANGLSGYFVGPDVGAQRGTVSWKKIENILVSSEMEAVCCLVAHDEASQWMRSWKLDDEIRLRIDRECQTTSARGQLRLARGADMDTSKIRNGRSARS